MNRRRERTKHPTSSPSRRREGMTGVERVLTKTTMIMGVQSDVVTSLPAALPDAAKGATNKTTNGTPTNNANPNNANPNTKMTLMGDSFPSKAFLVIDHCDQNDADVACWSDEGTHFLVKDTAEFAMSHLPRCFKHSNFASFVRQLNLYGFRTVKDDKLLLQLSGDTHPNANDNTNHHHHGATVVFHHEFFRRGRPDLLDEIKRSKSGDRSSRKQTPKDAAAAAAAGTNTTTSATSSPAPHKMESSEDADRRLEHMEHKLDFMSQKLDLLISLVTVQNQHVLASSSSPSRNNNGNCNYPHPSHIADQQQQQPHPSQPFYVTGEKRRRHNNNGSSTATDGDQQSHPNNPMSDSSSLTSHDNTHPFLGSPSARYISNMDALDEQKEYQYDDEYNDNNDQDGCDDFDFPTEAALYKHPVILPISNFRDSKPAAADDELQQFIDDMMMAKEDASQKQRGTTSTTYHHDSQALGDKRNPATVPGEEQLFDEESPPLTTAIEITNASVVVSDNDMHNNGQLVMMKKPNNRYRVWVGIVSVVVLLLVAVLVPTIYFSTKREKNTQSKSKKKPYYKGSKSSKSKPLSSKSGGTQSNLRWNETSTKYIKKTNSRSKSRFSTSSDSDSRDDPPPLAQEAAAATATATAASTQGSDQTTNNKDCPPCMLDTGTASTGPQQQQQPTQDQDQETGVSAPSDTTADAMVTTTAEETKQFNTIPSTLPFHPPGRSSHKQDLFSRHATLPSPPLHALPPSPPVVLDNELTLALSGSDYQCHLVV
eukprot:scaffold26276_cov55-Attheya_sp.AAC.8